jgi:hypothetical protein
VAREAAAVRDELIPRVSRKSGALMPGCVMRVFCGGGGGGRAYSLRWWAQPGVAKQATAVREDLTLNKCEREMCFQALCARVLAFNV